jgi:AbrB family looped-hinge helix DNA binding protein
MAQRTTKVASKYRVTIPKEVREALRIRKGDVIAFVPTRDGYLIRRAEDLVRWLADTMKGVEETIRESRRGMRPREVMNTR